MGSIAEWLESLGLSEYMQRFADNGIDFSVLRELTDQDLKDLGILLGHRRKMLRAIAELECEPIKAAAKPSRQGDAERRQLTIMFCDLVGSTALSARLDPEDMRDVILAFQDACAQVMPTYDGFIAKFQGDGVLTYFGYPRAHEDDAERAVRAGLDILTAVGQIRSHCGSQLRVRIGIATGLVVVGDLIGEGASQERAVVGDTVNLAARLQAVAEPETIVIAGSTRRLIGNFFKLRDRLCQVKGLPEFVQAWVVEGVVATESRFEAVRTSRLTSLVGREKEIALLLDRKHSAWKGEGQIMLVSGEAGIGKSRIATALSERLGAEPHARLRYQCSPYHTNSALHPFIAQLERAAEIKADDPPDKALDKLEAVLAMGASRVQAVAPIFAALLSIPFSARYPPLTLSPAQQRRQTFAALLDQLEGLARCKPILLLFEDAHWADATSLELLDLMADRVGHLPILAIVTFRPGFEPAWAGLRNVTELSLGRLDRTQVQAMVEQLTGGRQLPAEVTGQIVGKTDGIPLFVEELTKAVLEAGILVENTEGYRLDGPLPSLAIPATLQDSLMARLDRLAAVKEMAQVGAAIGREFSYTLLRAVTGRNEASLDSALSQLEESGLLFRTRAPPDVRYTFKHALVQDAAYESLLKSRRQVLHRRIAEALRERFPTTVDTEPEVVVHHYTQAGLTEGAVEWWGKAGDRALQAFAYKEAIAHLEKALSLVEHLSDGRAQRLLRLRLQSAYGYALIHSRGPASQDATAAFTTALQVAAGLEPEERFSTYYGLWLGSFNRAETARMRELAEAFLEDVRVKPRSPEAGIANRILGQTVWFEGDYLGARHQLELALSANDHEHDRQLASRFGFYPGIHAMFYLAWVLWPLGEVNRATQIAKEALSLARQSGHIPTLAMAHDYVCMLAAIRRKPSEMMPHARAVVGLAHEHGLPLWQAHGSVFLGWSRWCAGDHGGEDGMREGLRLLQEVKTRHWQSFYRTLLAEAEVEAGRPDAGLATMNAQLAAIEQTGERWFAAEMHRVRGDLLLKRCPPDTATAEAAFRHAIEIARTQQTRTFELRTSLALAKLYQATSRGKAAQELLVPAVAGFTEGPELPEVAEPIVCSPHLSKCSEWRDGARHKLARATWTRPHARRFVGTTVTRTGIVPCDPLATLTSLCRLDVPLSATHPAGQSLRFHFRGRSHSAHDDLLIAQRQQVEL
jgi:class 3 adenylate cyclase/predicted ATPase